MNRNKYRFLQSLVIVPLINVMSSKCARYGIIASLHIFIIAPRKPSGHTDSFLLLIAKRFLVMLILIVNILSQGVEFASGMSCSRLKTEAQ